LRRASEEVAVSAGDEVEGKPVLLAAETPTPVAPVAVADDEPHVGTAYEPDPATAGAAEATTAVAPAGDEPDAPAADAAGPADEAGTAGDPA
jgi:hypothetical protein